ncbi:unnamed protein product [Rotaria socialis]|uniref:Uncharacterized protein n=1 Tax=Rotaria socialis TaxID=392032 RepID=A0A821IH99_9BILA|nr:unnamed protein product [Rotaria socialis]CAF3419571.1 unnamed protein product [Rotaria socialis]CAF3435493.1 unnamed protein product [Rotaria socialis]CAF3546380.1 unnamed protein product [Rotaria socialis]CAF3602455.1 unnamed protein product [Rotaria socialis]
MCWSWGYGYIPPDDKEEEEEPDLYGERHLCGELDLYGKRIKLRMMNKRFWWIPHLCLLITTSSVIATTLLVLIDGMILNTVYLPPNRKCTRRRDMDCYSTSDNYTHFYCNSSDILITEFLGSVTCYGWYDGISTVDNLEQIGLCAELIQVFNWMVNLYLRLLLYSYAFPRTTVDTGYERRWLAVICTILSFLSPMVALVTLKLYTGAVAGLTIAFITCVLLMVILMLILTLTWRRNVAKTRKEQATRKHFEMTVITGKIQQRSTEIDKIRLIRRVKK